MANPALSGKCGSKWMDRVIVRGTLPKTGGFGNDYTRVLEPVVTDLLKSTGKLGWDGSYEHDRHAQLRARLEQLAGELEVASASLPFNKTRNLELMLKDADQHLKAIEVIHDRWNLRPEGTYSLKYGDTLRDFPSARYWQDCVNPDNILSPPGPHHGFEVEGWGRGGNVICPGRAELLQRPKDRAAIVDFYRIAARLIRCAEFTMWRNLLYARAKADYVPPRPEPPRPGPGGITIPIPPRDLPPSDPPDAPVPEYGPDGPAPPELPDHVGPFTVTTPPRPTHEPAPATPSRGDMGGLVLAGGAMAAFFGLAKVLTRKG